MDETKKKINWFAKPTWQDWIMLVVIAFAIALWYFYQMDVSNIHAWYQTNCICPIDSLNSFVPVNLTLP